MAAPVTPTSARGRPAARQLRSALLADGFCLETPTYCRGLNAYRYSGPNIAIVSYASKRPQYDHCCRFYAPTRKMRKPQTELHRTAVAYHLNQKPGHDKVGMVLSQAHAQQDRHDSTDAVKEDFRKSASISLPVQLLLLEPGHVLAPHEAAVLGWKGGNVALHSFPGNDESVQSRDFRGHDQQFSWRHCSPQPPRQHSKLAANCEDTGCRCLPQEARGKLPL